MTARKTYSLEYQADLLFQIEYADTRMGTLILSPRPGIIIERNNTHYALVMQRSSHSEHFFPETYKKESDEGMWWATNNYADILYDIYSHEFMGTEE